MTVSGVNIVKRHLKDVRQGSRGGTTGGIVSSEAPIHASNVQLVVEDDGDEVSPGSATTGSRSTKRRPDGSKYRHSAASGSPRTGEEI